MEIKNWKTKNSKIKIENKKGKTVIINDSNIEAKIYSCKILKCKNEHANVEFKAKIINGAGAVLKLINRHKQCRMDAILNSECSSTDTMNGYLLPVIVIKPNTSIEIEKVKITTSKKPENTYNKFMGKKRILLITPSYPSPDNLYACGFVHSRVKEYIKQGLEVEVASVYKYNSMAYYEIEGVPVYRTDYSQLRSILMGRKYDALLVHFFDEEYAYYLDTSYIKDTPIFLWNHGADILYWNYKEFYTPYFTDEYVLPQYLEKSYKKRDKYIKKFADKENVYWIFVSESERKEAEKMHNLNFSNSIIIPNIINQDIFSYTKKDPELRKNIFMVRRFDNTKKYAIDIAVLTILELARRPFFGELSFYICGEGDYHSQLVEPIRKYPNVHIINNFLTHEQIKEYHDKCGIGLFPTRQDTQGVSALEAASSGLAVVTSDLEVIHEYFDDTLKTICPIEDFKAYADVIERLYYNVDEFQIVSKRMNENTTNKCGKQSTINREIGYIKEKIVKINDIIRPVTRVAEDPIVTITIPSYNAEKFLDKCLPSLLKSEYAYLTEILVINDGSKDKTKEIGKFYENLTTVNGKSIVKLIDKENGGHGSGINKGLELARGKYFKVVDADDWVDEEQYNELLKRLIDEDADLILTDYSEARSFEDKLHKVEYYKNLTPDIQYHLDDVCIGTYGFANWGPTLPTSTYKTECLRKANFKLLEKTFYVDMMYNAYSILCIDTVKRYDLNVYRYYIGNAGQSVSEEGMKKNYKHHENVIIELMKIVSNDSRFSNEKREYVLRRLMLPMVYVQYYINLDLFHSRKKFMVFEKRVKKFPQLIGYSEFNKRNTKFHRHTKGIFVGINPFLKRQTDKVRRIFYKIKQIIKNVLIKVKKLIKR